MRNLRFTFISLLLLLAVVLATARQAAAATRAEAPVADAGIERAIRHYRATTLQLRGTMGVPTRFPALGRVSTLRARSIWRYRAVAATR